MTSMSHVFFTFFFFKQKTAYEMRISDWSSDVCSSDLAKEEREKAKAAKHPEKFAAYEAPAEGTEVPETDRRPATRQQPKRQTRSQRKGGGNQTNPGGKPKKQGGSQ